MSKKICPLPDEFLEWQVRLRRHTMHERNGAPHIGVIPLVFVKRPGVAVGGTAHSVVCGLLPEESSLDTRTREFRALYEEGVEKGARHVYDRGVEYLLSYYDSRETFSDDTLTTLLPKESDLAIALRAQPRCALVFNVFEANAQEKIFAPRCQQIDASAEIHESGPVFDNVWWHNTIFHGMADDHVVIRFRHEKSWDTRFGSLQSL